MKLLSIVGARPQFIKLAPLSMGLEGRHKEIIVHTGQHYDYALSEQIFTELGIRKPDVHLGIGSGSHAQQTGKMMISLEEVMLKEKPDAVIVFGDTNSTLAGAMATSKLNIPLIHIEAGLRSYNRSMPEEINRIATDHVSELLLAPTATAMKILKNEGLGKRAWLVGDIMVDSLLTNYPIAEEKSDIMARLHLSTNDYSLLTLHRNYNVDDPKFLLNILNQLDDLEEKIIFPVHPRTRKILSELDFSLKNIQVTEALGYLDFLMLEKNAHRIITDSGGIQKEAYIFRKPCITLRTETEWTETVEEKWNLLLDPHRNDLAAAISNFTVPLRQKKVFGENVATKIIDIMDRFI